MIKILLLLLFLIVNVGNKHSNKMAGIRVVSPTCQFANDQFTNFEVDSSTSRSNV